MLVYIALALGYLPAGAHPAALLVTGRLGLGFGGVVIVAASVLAALGLCSLCGMWSTLIIMEVRLGLRDWHDGIPSENAGICEKQGAPALLAFAST